MSDVIRCLNCDGTGEVPTPSGSAWRLCHSCGGTGLLDGLVVTLRPVTNVPVREDLL